jgi:hypothetical protein
MQRLEVSSEVPHIYVDRRQRVKLMKASILSCIFLLHSSLYTVSAYNTTATCSMVSLLWLLSIHTLKNLPNWFPDYIIMICCLHTTMLLHMVYRVIHKSLRDFRPLQYSSRDGHIDGEHVNRGRKTPSFCPTLQVLDMSTLGDKLSTWQMFLAHARQSLPMALAGLFVSQHRGSHSTGISCTTHELFCP